MPRSCPVLRVLSVLRVQTAPLKVPQVLPAPPDPLDRMAPLVLPALRVPLELPGPPESRVPLVPPGQMARLVPPAQSVPPGQRVPPGRTVQPEPLELQVPQGQMARRAQPGLRV